MPLESHAGVFDDTSRHAETPPIDRVAGPREHLKRMGLQR